ncbi:MAG: hypothetical protein Q4A96_00580, partial [Candidatus Saccharibacteria bacterium]|nr:hypothetical protein [Candidatus Saccharibacteria bacterium]
MDNKSGNPFPPERADDLEQGSGSPFDILGDVQFGGQDDDPLGRQAEADKHAQRYEDLRKEKDERAQRLEEYESTETIPFKPDTHNERAAQADVELGRYLSLIDPSQKEAIAFVQEPGVVDFLNDTQIAGYSPIKDDMIPAFRASFEEWKGKQEDNSSEIDTSSEAPIFENSSDNDERHFDEHYEKLNDPAYMDSLKSLSVDELRRGNIIGARQELERRARELDNAPIETSADNSKDETDNGTQGEDSASVPGDSVDELLRNIGNGSQYEGMTAEEREQYDREQNLNLLNDEFGAEWLLQNHPEISADDLEKMDSAKLGQLANERGRAYIESLMAGFGDDDTVENGDSNNQDSANTEEQGGDSNEKNDENVGVPSGNEGSGEKSDREKAIDTLLSEGSSWLLVNHKEISEDDLRNMDDEQLGALTKEYQDYLEDRKKYGDFLASHGIDYGSSDYWNLPQEKQVALRKAFKNGVAPEDFDDYIKEEEEEFLRSKRFDEFLASKGYSFIDYIDLPHEQRDALKAEFNASDNSNEDESEQESKENESRAKALDILSGDAAEWLAKKYGDLTADDLDKMSLEDLLSLVDDYMEDRNEEESEKLNKFLASKELTPEAFFNMSDEERAALMDEMVNGPKEEEEAPEDTTEEEETPSEETEETEETTEEEEEAPSEEDGENPDEEDENSEEEEENAEELKELLKRGRE